MTLRLYVPGLQLAAGRAVDLPPGPARHAQVRRVQPGDALLLFDGSGCDWPAVVMAVGRSSVGVRVGDTPLPVASELPWQVTVALAMPANERMDALVEKATELGVARVQPLISERSVLRLAGDRAEKKRAHWQAIAEAACEQCGRARVPVVAPVLKLIDWLPHAAPGARWLLSFAADSRGPHAMLAATASGAQASITTLNGPEGGLAPDEEAVARSHGFAPLSIGPRVLRADTAPLAVLAWLGLRPGA